MKDDKKRKFGWDNWVRELDQQHGDKAVYDLDEIIDQLEKGDYSSMDPEIRKEIEEREQKEKRKKVAQPKRKELTP
jgi:hypothetical protein